MTDWAPTFSIQMSVNSAEMHIMGTRGRVELHLNCSLMNIVRGSANVIIKRLPKDNITFSGAVHIPLERPVMKFDIDLPFIAFEQLTAQFNHAAPRPISLIALLDETLMVNLAGDLRIETARDCTVTDISWVLPIT